MISGHVGAEQPTAEFGTFLSLPSDERGFWQPEVSGGGYLLGKPPAQVSYLQGQTTTPTCKKRDLVFR